MLCNLHVRNLALIEESDITFSEGLNVLTGETGAGKSILLGALALSLGGKADKSLLRDPEKEGMAQAVFSVSEKEGKQLLEWEVEPEDGEVICTRKMNQSRTQAKLNGESVPAKILRKTGETLLDIYGQHDSEALLSAKKHITLIDAYARVKLEPVLLKLEQAYHTYNQKKRELSQADLDESERLRELSFLEHEIAEIEDASLSPGEDEELESLYRKMKNGQKIQGAVSAVYDGIAGDDGALDRIGVGLRELSAILELDGELEGYYSTLSDAEGILSDLSRGISDYERSLEFDGEVFANTGQRLDLINELKVKYRSNQIQGILDALEEKQKRIEELSDYAAYRERLSAEAEAAEKELTALCEKASRIRKTAAKELCKRVAEGLLELNFLDAGFEMHFSKGSYSARGWDEAEFFIRSNPGEPLRPLSKTASGGELSRIMLQIKTVLSDKDEISTMIFDEIDTGISGRTAQAVANKLKILSKDHQVILITHLPQIAAMADRHFRIEKSANQKSTISSITPLDEEGCVEELSRMLGGSEITDAVRENAREMRRLAREAEM